MAIGRATRKKLILLGIGVALVAAVGVLYVARQARISRGLEESLREGMAAYEAERFEDAIPHLSRYVGRRRDNPDVLLAFADARHQVPSPDGTDAYLRQSLAVTRLALDLRPESIKGQRMLMEIAMRLRYLTEANEAANAILEQDPADVDAHYVRLLAARATGRDDECINVARQMAAARPDDFVVQSIAIDELARANLPMEELRRHAQERREAFAGRMASELLGAQVSLHRAGRAEGSEERTALAAEFAQHMRAAISLKPQTPEEAVKLLHYLDLDPALATETSADEILRGYLADPELAPGLLSFALARAWQRSDGDMIREIARDHEDLSSLPDEALGWLAISLPEESRFREELSRRSGGTVDEWRQLAEALELLQNEDLVEARAKLAPLLASGETTALLAQFIDAMSLEALGESSLAQQRLQTLADMPAWVRARVVLRELAFRRGDYLAAYELVRRDNLPGTALFHLETVVALDESGHQWPPGEPSGRQLADRAMLNFPDDPAIASLHGRAELAAGNVARAGEVADQLVAMQPDRGAQQVLRFADRLEAHDPQRAAALRSRYAVATDPLAALVEEIQGSDITTEELRSRIEAATAGAGAEAQLRGRLLMAGALDEAGDPAAAEEFKRLAAENPKNAQIQIAALNSRSLWTDLETVPPVVERLRSLTGEDGVSWRVFEFKHTLLRDDSEAAAARVVNGLSSVLRVSPNDLTALQLMAEAMTRVKDYGRAASYATRAADVAPESLSVSLDAVEALVRAGQMEAATDRLRRAVSLPNQRIASRLRRAILLTRFGLITDALIDWTWLAHTGDPENRARAALVLAQLDKSDEAASVVAELAVRDDLTAAARVMTADALAALGREADGLTLLEAMGESDAEDGRVAMIAGYLARHADSPEQVRRLEDYVRATDDARAWAALVRKHMGDGNVEVARRVLSDAMERVDDKTELAAFSRALDPETELDPKAFLAVAQANLSTLNTGWSRELSDELDRVIAGDRTLAQFTDYLRGFVRSRPSILLGWMLLSQAEATAGDLAAVRLTIQTMLEAIPADPSAASYAVGLCRRTRMADEGLLAAREYASRIPSPTLESARNIAQFALAAERPQEAWDAIAPWRDRFESDEDLALYARAALSLGRMPDAEAVAWAPDRADEPWLHESVRMAEVIQRAPDRAAWLEKAGARLSPGDERGRFLLANGWYGLAIDAGDAAALRTALELSQRGASDPDVAASLRLLEASCLSQLGRSDEAIAAYQDALQRRPDDPDALNNLAYLLIEKGGSVEEALGYARRAVETLRSRGAPPDRLVEYLDTLGSALLEAGQPTEALAAFEEALRARPTYDFALVGLSETYAALGRSDEARQTLAKITGPISPSLSERVRDLRETLE